MLIKGCQLPKCKFLILCLLKQGVTRIFLQTRDFSLSVGHLSVTGYIFKCSVTNHQLLRLKLFYRPNLLSAVLCHEFNWCSSALQLNPYFLWQLILNGFQSARYKLEHCLQAKYIFGFPMRFKKIHYLTREFHVNLHLKNRYRTQRGFSIRAISVFRMNSLVR